MISKNDKDRTYVVKSVHDTVLQHDVRLRDLVSVDTEAAVLVLGDHDLGARDGGVGASREVRRVFDSVSDDVVENVAALCGVLGRKDGDGGGVVDRVDDALLLGGIQEVLGAYGTCGVGEGEGNGEPAAGSCVSDPSRLSGGKSVEKQTSQPRR